MSKGCFGGATAGDHGEWMEGWVMLGQCRADGLTLDGE